MANPIERYHEILAGRGMKVGDQVICTFRCPQREGWWNQPFHVGVILPVSDDPGSWNGRQSEAQFCARALYIKVQYLRSAESPGLLLHEDLSRLLPLHFGTVEESPTFGPDDYEGLRRFAARCGMLHHYPKRCDYCDRIAAETGRHHCPIHGEVSR